MNPRVLLPLVCLAMLGADWANHPENLWVLQSPTSDRPAPKFGWEGSGSYDPFGKQWIHFGGHDGIPQGFHLFTYDLGTRAWEQRFPPTSPPGVCCIDGSHTFDVANRRFVCFPGGSLGHGYQWSRGVKLKNSAVWLYDPAANTWTNMRPPPYHRPFTKEENIGGLDAGATYDPRNELAVSFGGQGSGGGTSNLFLYDAYANALYRVTAADPPSPRDGMGITCDPKNECLVVFGSQYASDEKTYLYRYRTGKWEAHDLDPHPPGKKGKTYSTIPKMAYDSLNEVCLCLVWDDATGNHETWTFDVAKLRWTKMEPATEPERSMSRSRNLSFSAEHNVFILDTNPAAQKGTSAQIWTYRYKTAPADKRPAAPENVEVVTESNKAVLTWSAVAGVKEYRVHRADAAEPWKLTFARVGAVPGVSFEDRDVAAGKTYFYTVRAVAADGTEGPDSRRARTQSRVLVKPVVSVLAADKVEVSWNKHPAKDVAGYNVYCGLVSVRTVKKGTPAPWKDNDPEYAEPTPVEVSDITGIKKLNEKPLTETSLIDKADLASPGPESKDYKYAVYAYIVRAVNNLGVESGPSPYALTIPSEPVNVLNRENGNTAELKWDANPEKGIAGYHVYKLEDKLNIVRLTTEPIKETTFSHKNGLTRYWVVAVDALGQEGQPSSPVWHQQSYKGFFKGEWHQ
jgi:fibronectin type 3 domain-containing protein